MLLLGRLPLAQLCTGTKIIGVPFMPILFLLLVFSFKLPANAAAAVHLDVWNLRAKPENEKRPPGAALTSPFPRSFWPPPAWLGFSAPSAARVSRGRLIRVSVMSLLSAGNAFKACSQRQMWPVRSLAGDLIWGSGKKPSGSKTWEGRVQPDQVIMLVVKPRCECNRRPLTSQGGW